MVEEGKILSEVELPMDSLARKAIQVHVFFFFDFSRPLEFVPISRERVVPSVWQVRSVLGDCMSKARVISIQAPRCRQFALIIDFLDPADFSIREEATLATNWIKHRLEGLKLGNLALATITDPALRSYPKNTTADVQHALKTGESLGSGKQWILHGNPLAIARDFFTACVSSSMSFFRICSLSDV